MIESIFTLLIIFQIKHWLCYYPLQFQFMLKKFQREGWVLPLAYHAGMHSLFTTTIASVYFLIAQPNFEYTNIVILLGLLDFTIHFITDRVKAHPDLGGRYKADNPKFWWSLGADQGIHHLTHYLIIYIVIML